MFIYYAISTICVTHTLALHILDFAFKCKRLLKFPMQHNMKY